MSRQTGSLNFSLTWELLRKVRPPLRSVSWHIQTTSSTSAARRTTSHPNGTALTCRIRVGLPDATSPQSIQPGYWERKDLTFPNEDCVLKVAGKCSVNPSKLDKMGLEASLGLLRNPDATYP